MKDALNKILNEEDELDSDGNPIGNDSDDDDAGTKEGDQGNSDDGDDDEGSDEGADGTGSEDGDDDNSSGEGDDDNSSESGEGNEEDLDVEPEVDIVATFADGDIDAAKEAIRQRALDAVAAVVREL